MKKKSLVTFTTKEKMQSIKKIYARKLIKVHDELTDIIISGGKKYVVECVEARDHVGKAFEKLTGYDMNNRFEYLSDNDS